MAASNLKYCLQFIYFKAIYNIVTVLTNDITDLPASKVKLAVSKITHFPNGQLVLCISPYIQKK